MRFSDDPGRKNNRSSTISNPAAGFLAGVIGVILQQGGQSCQPVWMNCCILMLVANLFVGMAISMSFDVGEARNL